MAGAFITIGALMKCSNLYTRAELANCMSRSMIGGGMTWFLASMYSGATAWILFDDTPRDVVLSMRSLSTLSVSSFLPPHLLMFGIESAFPAERKLKGPSFGEDMDYSPITYFSFYSSGTDSVFFATFYQFVLELTSTRGLAYCVFVPSTKIERIRLAVFYVSATLLTLANQPSNWNRAAFFNRLIFTYIFVASARYLSHEILRTCNSLLQYGKGVYSSQLSC